MTRAMPSMVALKAPIYNQYRLQCKPILRIDPPERTGTGFPQKAAATLSGKPGVSAG